MPAAILEALVIERILTRPCCRWPDFGLPRIKSTHRAKPLQRQGSNITALACRPDDRIGGFKSCSVRGSWPGKKAFELPALGIHNHQQSGRWGHNNGCPRGDQERFGYGCFAAIKPDRVMRQLRARSGSR